MPAISATSPIRPRPSRDGGRARRHRPDAGAGDAPGQQIPAAAPAQAAGRQRRPLPLAETPAGRRASSPGWTACWTDLDGRNRHPTSANASRPSIIVFTTLSGLGYGLAAVLGLGLLDPASVATKAAYVAWRSALIAGGLLSSTLHLGNPQRAWRALSQWRSSWLSREGVLAFADLRAARSGRASPRSSKAGSPLSPALLGARAARRHRLLHGDDLRLAEVGARPGTRG